MFEAAELGRKVSKSEYATQLPDLRSGLLAAQVALRPAGVPVILVFSGADGAGKSETVQRLHEWLDPRGLETNAFGPPSDEERERPAAWRFWRTLPARGRIGMYLSSWYTDPLVKRAYGKLRGAELDGELNRIAFFEQMLVDDGALLLKFWLHLPKKAQKKRLQSLAGDKETRWRVSPLEWKHYKLYDRFIKASERIVRRSDSARAPWFLIEAEDPQYRELMVGRILLEAMRRRLSGNGDGLVPIRLEARYPVPQRPCVMRTKRLDVIDLEPGGLCGSEHDRQRQELSIGKHIGVDEGATCHQSTQNARQESSAGRADARRLCGDGMVQEEAAWLEAVARRREVCGHPPCPDVLRHAD